MATVPWTTTAPPAAEVDAVVFGSLLQLRSFRDIPAFMGAAMKLRKQVRDMPGAFGVSLTAQPTRKTFWTLSAWADQWSLDAFVALPAHVDVMRRFHDRLERASFTTWTVNTANLPASRSNAKEMWSEAKRRLAATTSGEPNTS